MVKMGGGGRGTSVLYFKIKQNTLKAFKIAELKRLLIMCQPSFYFMYRQTYFCSTKQTCHLLFVEV